MAVDGGATLKLLSAIISDEGGASYAYADVPHPPGGSDDTAHENEPPLSPCALDDSGDESEPPICAVGDSANGCESEMVNTQLPCLQPLAPPRTASADANVCDSELVQLLLPVLLSSEVPHGLDINAEECEADVVRPNLPPVCASDELPRPADDMKQAARKLPALFPVSRWWDDDDERVEEHVERARQRLRQRRARRVAEEQLQHARVEHRKLELERAHQERLQHIRQRKRKKRMEAQAKSELERQSEVNAGLPAEKGVNGVPSSTDAPDGRAPLSEHEVAAGARRSRRVDSVGPDFEQARREAAARLRQAALREKQQDIDRQQRLAEVRKSHADRQSRLQQKAAVGPQECARRVCMGVSAEKDQEQQAPPPEEEIAKERLARYRSPKSRAKLKACEQPMPLAVEMRKRQLQRRRERDAEIRKWTEMQKSNPPDNPESEGGLPPNAADIQFREAKLRLHYWQSRPA